MMITKGVDDQINQVEDDIVVVPNETAEPGGHGHLEDEKDSLSASYNNVSEQSQDTDNDENNKLTRDGNKPSSEARAPGSVQSFQIIVEKQNAILEPGGHGHSEDEKDSLSASYNEQSKDTDNKPSPEARAPGSVQSFQIIVEKQNAILEPGGHGHSEDEKDSLSASYNEQSKDTDNKPSPEARAPGSVRSFQIIVEKQNAILEPGGHGHSEDEKDSLSASYNEQSKDTDIDENDKQTRDGNKPSPKARAPGSVQSFHIIVEKQNVILRKLLDLQLSVVKEMKYRCFEGLHHSLEKFIKSFSQCIHQRTELHEESSLVLEHQCYVANAFIVLKQEEMTGIDHFFSPLIENGYKPLCNETSHLDDPPSFLVNLSLFCEDDIGDDFASMLDARPSGTHPKKKLKKQYKWWIDPEITSQLEDALKRKLCNDDAGLDCTYLIGMMTENAGDEDGILLSYQKGQWFPWMPPVPPDGARTFPTTSEIRVEWSFSNHVLVDSHVISLLQDDSNGDRFTIKQHISNKNHCVFTDLDSDTSHWVEVRTMSQLLGVSTDCVITSVRTKKVLSLAKRMKSCVDEGALGVGEMRGKDKLCLFTAERQTWKSKGFHLAGEPTVNCIQEVDVIPNFEPNVDFGNMEDSLIVVLTGETGAGKSTHINAMVNWLFGVELEDSFRLLLIDDSNMKSTSSVTQHITVYRIRHIPGMPLDKSLIIVDSPGYADSRSLKADDFTTDAFRQLFKHLSHVNCVGLVMKAYDERLTASTRYVIEKMLQLFHTSIKDNILPICTFADHGEPTCLEGLRTDDVAFQFYVKVQNSMFSCRSVNTVCTGKPVSDAMRQEQNLYWQIAYNGITLMFKIIANRMVLQPLQSSSTVLETRKELQETLQIVIHALSETTARVATVMQLLNVVVNVLGKVPVEQITVNKSESVKTNLPTGVHVTLCSHCNVTCHNNCKIVQDAKKARCSSMDKRGRCRICPKKCSWTKHHNAPYYWEVKTTAVKVVPEDLIKRWAGENGSHEQAILNGLELVERKQQHVLGLLNQCVELQEELRAVSLRNNPRIALAYVESLIQMQKDRGANEDVLQALHVAKKQLRLQNESRRQRAIFNAKKAALECIKDELGRRSQLDHNARLHEERQPSEFYNTVWSKVPREIRDTLPPPLKAQTNRWSRGSSFPPFSESLKRTGEALSALLRMGLS